MYREAKNTQTNIEKRKRNCKARRQKITDNKYTEREKERQHRQKLKNRIEMNILKIYVGFDSTLGSSFNVISVFSFVEGTDGEGDFFSRLTCLIFFDDEDDDEVEE